MSANRIHALTFAHDQDFAGPMCSACGREISQAMWLDGDECRYTLEVLLRTNSRVVNEDDLRVLGRARI